ncbi:enoyl-CoA hydratase/isomerase family protein [Roseomonas sp. AR75]|uniref:enoyl-CoA hydratase/isomerase family protein n=1 Tax=Roseomonas sp. AR75 TaxID=2562311 RepID=UPI0010BF8163|nr:enoyl-CoA hydratase/isomerase family protein [Roseomonas sp. AR75]
MSLHCETLDGGVLRLTLDRPRSANALDSALNAALVAALEDAARDAAVRAVLLTGAGGRVFSAGANLREDLGPDTKRLRREALLRSLLAMLDFPKPLLAVVRGKAVGGGGMLVLLADEALMEGGASLSMPEIGHGMPSPIGISILMDRGSRAAAQALMQAAESFDAARCLAAGLAAFVHDDAALDAAALDRARRLGALDARCFAANKHWMNARLRAELPLAAARAAELAETAHAH